MTINKRRILLGSLGLIVTILAVLAILGMVFERVSAIRITSQYPPPGKLYDVGGWRMHLNCVGRGPVTVVFESGLGDTSRAWSKIHLQVAEFSRACTYDRTGLGWSEVPRTLPPRDADHVVAELHTVLRKAGEQGPFVLVGHSLGGLEVQLYAFRFPAETAGLVLVDSVHPQQRVRLHREQQSAEYSKTLEWYKLGAPFGLTRLLHECLDEDAPVADCAQFYRVLFDEFTRLPESFSEANVLDKHPLGKKPLLVLSRDPNSAASLQDPAAPIWEQMQAELADELSENSVRWIVIGAGHGINSDKPEVVLEAIHRVIAAAENGVPLNGAPPAGAIVPAH